MQSGHFFTSVWFQTEGFSVENPSSASWNGYHCPSLLHFTLIWKWTKKRKKMPVDIFWFQHHFKQILLTQPPLFACIEEGKGAGNKNLCIVPYLGKGVVWESAQPVNNLKPCWAALQWHLHLLLPFHLS